MIAKRNLINKIRLRIISLFSKSIQKELNYYYSTLNQCALHLTNRCNLKCEMCEVWKNDFSIEKKSRFHIDEWKILIKKIAETPINHIQLIGGEPLLFAHLKDLVQIIKKNKMTCSMTTNGTLFKQDNLNWLLRDLEYISISIDGLKQTHDTIRGVNGTFDQIITNLKLISDMKNKSKEYRCKIASITTVSKSNVNEIGELINFLSKIKAIDNFQIQYISELPNDVFSFNDINRKPTFHSSGSSLLLDDNEIRILENTLKHLKSGSLAISINNNLELDKKYLKTGTVPKQKCYMIKNRIIIDYTGNVIPCSFYTDYSLGNIKEKTIQKIWTGRKRKIFIKLEKQQQLNRCNYCSCYLNRNKVL